MRELSGMAKKISCTDADRIFEERFLEEVISSDACLDFESHLKGCDRCRGLYERILKIKHCADEVSELEVEAARRRLSLQRAAFSRPPLGRAKWTIAAAAAVAVVAVAAVANIGLRQTSVDGEPLSEAAVCRPSAVTAPAPGIRTAYCGASEPTLRVAPSGEVRVVLKTGTVGLDVDPGRLNPKAVVVETRAGEVRVKGTLFAVRGGPEPRVEVFRGAVEFRPAAGGTPLSVSEGEGAELLSATLFQRSSFQTVSLRRALDDAAVNSRPSFSESSATTPSDVEKSPDETVSAAVEAVNTGASSKAASEVRPGSENAKRSSTIDRLIGEAQTCLIDRDWSCASARYNEVLRRFPGRPESTAVLVSLARLELRVLHQPEKALRHYKAYRWQAPNGVLAEEAMYGIAAVYRTMEDAASEKDALRRFIARYPGSGRAAQARARLRRLEGTVLPEDPTTEP